MEKNNNNDNSNKPHQVHQMLGELSFSIGLNGLLIQKELESMKMLCLDVVASQNVGQQRL